MPRWTQEGPKKAPRWSNNAPRWPQDGPRGPQDSSKMVHQDDPARAQDGPKHPSLLDKQTIKLDILLWRPGSMRLVAKMGPRRQAPRWPKKAPRWPHDGPKRAQDAPRWFPKMAPRDPKHPSLLEKQTVKLDCHTPYTYIYIYIYIYIYTCIP